MCCTYDLFTKLLKIFYFRCSRNGYIHFRRHWNSVFRCLGNCNIVALLFHIQLQTVNLMPHTDYMSNENFVQSFERRSSRQTSNSVDINIRLDQIRASSPEPLLAPGPSSSEIDEQKEQDNDSRAPESAATPSRSPSPVASVSSPLADSQQTLLKRCTHTYTCAHDQVTYTGLSHTLTTFFSFSCSSQ